MKKEDVASLIVYFIMIAAAIIVTLSVIKDAIPLYAPERMNTFLFVLIAIILVFFVNVLFLEIFHAIGATIGGYKVTVFNVLGLCFEKTKNKWVFHFKDFNGLTGETKIAPKKEKLNLKPFIWLPLFGYAIEMAGSIVLYTQISQAQHDLSFKWLALVAILMIVISSMIALYNLVPIKLDSMTDGYRFVLLAKPVNTEAYNELLRIEDLERDGQEVKNIKIFDEITEFTANINLISVYHFLKDNKYEDAEKLIDMMIKDPKKIDPLTYNRMIAQKLYIELMNKPIEEARKTYNGLNDEIRRFIPNDVSMESIRSYILIAGLLEESRGEVNFAKTRINKAIKNTLPSRVVIEQKMYDQALEKVYSAHPDWAKENITD